MNFLEKMLNNPGKSMVGMMAINLVIVVSLFTGACLIVKAIFF